MDVCEYAGGVTVYAYAICYDFVVYEAATHNPVGEVSASYAGILGICAPVVEETTTKSLVEPNPENVHSALIDFVNSHSKP